MMLNNHLIPPFGNFIAKRKILESLQDEGIDSISMVDIVLTLKKKGYDNDKILKVKNLLDTDEKSDVAVEDLVDAFVNLGVNQDTIGDIMADLTVEDDYKKERLIFVVKDNKFYKYPFRKWKSVVDAVIRDQSLFDPEKYTEPIKKPKHIYKSSDGDYYSSLPNITVYNTSDWNLNTFKKLKDSGYKVEKS